MQLRSLAWEDPLEKEMATHSNILAWEIPWTEEPGGLQSTVLQTVRHDLATKQQQPGGKTMVSPRGTKGWSAHFYCSWLWCSVARVTRMQRLSRRRKTIIACNLPFSWQEVSKLYENSLEVKLTVSLCFAKIAREIFHFLFGMCHFAIWSWHRLNGVNLDAFVFQNQEANSLSEGTWWSARERKTISVTMKPTTRGGTGRH